MSMLVQGPISTGYNIRAILVLMLDTFLSPADISACNNPNIKDNNINEWLMR